MQTIERFFYSATINEKITLVRTAVAEALQNSTPLQINKPLFREISVCAPQDLPGKIGLAQPEGQARLMHDLASIELQACEMMFRTLVEFPQAPIAFREMLGQMIIEESQHLQICLDCLDNLNFKWGHWSVHNSLWEALTPKDSLIDRMVIIHRYLEGSGLDASSKILKRLNGVSASKIIKGVNVIFNEELNHVSFGSEWYRKLCELQNIDPALDFPNRIEKLNLQLPKRLEKINRNLRLKAGFTNEEINYLENRRLKIIGKLN